MRCAARFLVYRGEGVGSSSAFLHLDVFSGIEDDLAARTLGIELQPAVGGILMMVSTIIVAINAQLLRGVRV